MLIQKKVFHGTVWMVLLKISVKLIGLVSTLILVRLLSPEDFGLVGIIMAMFGLIETFTAFGFDTVLIQTKNKNEKDYNTAWTFNLIFGLISFLILFTLSDYIALFYSDEHLSLLVKVMSFLFIMNGINNIGTVDFRKDLTFKKEFIFQIFPKILSFFLTISLAFIYKNYWALVIGTLFWKGCIVVFSYIYCEYRPRFCIASWKSLFSFSRWLIVNNFVQFFNMKSPEMIIGKVVSPVAVGFYSVASELSSLLTMEMASVVNRASYPGYAKVSSNRDELMSLYANVLHSVAIIVVPASIGLVSISELVVPIFLGQKWTEVIPLVVILSLAYLLMSLNTNTGYIFWAIGKPHITTYLNAVRVAVFVPLLVFLSLKYGLLGSTISFLIVTFLNFIFINLINIFLLSLSLKRIISIYSGPFLSSLMMFLCVYSFKMNFSTSFINNYFLLFFCILIGVVSYFIFSVLWWFICGRPSGIEESIFKKIKEKLSDQIS